MFKAFVTGFLRNDPPPPPRKLTSKVSVLRFPIYSLKKTRNAYFWLFLDNIITDKEETKPNSCSDSQVGLEYPDYGGKFLEAFFTSIGQKGLNFWLYSAL